VGTMRSFAKGAICVACIVMTVLILLNHFYKPIYDKRIIHEQDLDTFVNFNNKPYRIDIANTGNSHGMTAINYEAAPIGTSAGAINFGLNSQSVRYDYNILRNYESYFDKDSTVIVQLSYFSLHYDEINDPRFRAKNIRYNYFLKPRYIDDRSQIEVTVQERFPLLIAEEKILIPFDRLLGREPRLRRSELPQTMTIDEMREDAKVAFQRHFPESIIEDINNNEYSPLEYEQSSFINKLEFCKKNRLKAMILVTPLSSYYLEYIPSKFFTQFNTIVGEIASDYGISIYDYSQDPRFVNDISLFINSDHLNIKGSEKFTKLLFGDAAELQPYITNAPK
jgi:hypothetical protein